MSSALSEIEERIPVLSFQERLSLIERLAQTLRGTPEGAMMTWDSALAAMAADTEIQREIREIEHEFACPIGACEGRLGLG